MQCMSLLLHKTQSKDSLHKTRLSNTMVPATGLFGFAAQLLWIGFDTPPGKSYRQVLSKCVLNTLNVRQ